MPQRILVVTPHPDDLEIGCAGTLMNLQNQGWNVQSIIMVKPSSEGRPGRNRSIVESELQASYQLSGFSLSVFDTELHANDRPNLVHDNVTMSRLSDIFEPADICILPNPEDYHQDHRNTFGLAWPLAIRRCKTVWIMHSWPYCYHYATSKPNLFRDISGSWAHKQRLLECYGSYIGQEQIDQIKHLNQVWGDQNNCDLSEAFTVMLDRG
jgi:LmbE family N-acetylglucosaminyl deacetylase